MDWSDNSISNFYPHIPYATGDKVTYMRETAPTQYSENLFKAGKLLIQE